MWKNYGINFECNCNSKNTIINRPRITTIEAVWEISDGSWRLSECDRVETRELFIRHICANIKVSKSESQLPTSYLGTFFRVVLIEN